MRVMIFMFITNQQQPPPSDSSSQKKLSRKSGWIYAFTPFSAGSSFCWLLLSRRRIAFHCAKISSFMAADFELLRKGKRSGRSLKNEDFFVLSVQCGHSIPNDPVLATITTLQSNWRKIEASFKQHFLGPTAQSHGDKTCCFSLANSINRNAMNSWELLLTSF